MPITATKKAALMLDSDVDERCVCVIISMLLVAITPDGPLRFISGRSPGLRLVVWLAFPDRCQWHNQPDAPLTVAGAAAELAFGAALLFPFSSLTHDTCLTTKYISLMAEGCGNCQLECTGRGHRCRLSTLPQVAPIRSTLRVRQGAAIPRYRKRLVARRT